MNSTDVAKSMMADIQNDSGCALQWEGGFQYPDEWVEMIAEAWEVFYDQNLEQSDITYDDKYIEDVAREIAIGGEDTKEKYLELPGYERLDTVLNEYFESL